MDKSEIKRRWRVINDLQGGSFGMGRVYTAEEWLDCMVDWRDSDGSWHEWDEGLNGYSREREQAINWWTEQIKTAEGEDALIEYIAEMWQIEFEVVDQHLIDAYERYLEQFNNAEGDPVCIDEWLDNEGAELKK